MKYIIVKVYEFGCQDIVKDIVAVVFPDIEGQDKKMPQSLLSCLVGKLE